MKGDQIISTMPSTESKSIQWARICFSSKEYDKNRYDVPIKNIKIQKNDRQHFQPANEFDFDSQRHYYARWDCQPNCKEHENGKHYAYYKARILLLAGWYRTFH